MASPAASILHQASGLLVITTSMCFFVCLCLPRTFAASIMGEVLAHARREEDLEADLFQEFEAACAEMHTAVVEHEYYCSAYSSKEQPKLQALLSSMSKSLEGLEKELASMLQENPDFPAMDRALKIMHRLVSATNRANHKGRPSFKRWIFHQASRFFIDPSCSTLVLFHL